MRLPRICLFNHIPKCGGTTLMRLLGQAFARHETTRHEGDGARVARALNRNVPEGDCCVTGHFVWGLHEQLRFACDVSYVTMLREPLSLFKSYYNYTLKKYNAFFTPEAFLYSQYEPNPLCLHLAHGDVGLAKKRLAEDYAAFGVMEDYGRSLDLFSRVWSVDLPDYAKENVSHSGEVVLDAKALRSFAGKNRDDLALYAWARDFFETRLADKTRAGRTDRRERKPRAVHAVPCRQEILALVRAGKYAQVLRLAEHFGLKSGLDGLTLLGLHQGAGDEPGWLKEAVSQRRRNTISVFNLAIAVFRSDATRALAILNAQCRANRPQPSATPDSCRNKYFLQCQTVAIELRLALGGSDREALAGYREAFELGLPSLRLATSYADFLMRRGEYGQAVAVLRAVPNRRANAAWHSRKLVMLGECRRHLGELARARRSYRAACLVFDDPAPREAFVTFLARNASCREAIAYVAARLGQGAAAHPAASPEFPLLLLLAYRLHQRARDAAGHAPSSAASHAPFDDVGRAPFDVAGGPPFDAAACAAFNAADIELLPTPSAFVLRAALLLHDDVPAGLAWLVRDGRAYPEETVRLLCWFLARQRLPDGKATAQAIAAALDSVLEAWNRPLAVLDRDGLRAALGVLTAAGFEEKAASLLRRFAARTTAGDRVEVLLLTGLFHIEQRQPGEVLAALLQAYAADGSRAVEVLGCALQLQEALGQEAARPLLDVLEPALAGDGRPTPKNVSIC